MHARRTDRLRESGVIAILRGVDSDAVVDVADAVVDGGVTALEVTADTPDVAETIGALADRFDDVVIENLHWRELVDKYDSDETVLYFDPPYVGTEDYYPTSEIEHGELVDTLGDLDGYGICSYQELPEGTEDLRVVGRGSKNYINSGTSGSANETRERLLLNFDPEKI